MNLPLSLGKLTDAQAQLVISFLMGAIAPYLTALVNNPKMTDQARVATSAIVALLLAVLQVAITGQLTNVGTLAQAFALIWPISQTMYRNVALKFGVRALEQATSPTDLRSGDTKPLPTSSTEDAKAALKSTPEVPSPTPAPLADVRAAGDE